MSTAVSQKLTAPAIVLVISKAERGIAMMSVLNRAGYTVHQALSLYDAVALIGQELPHLVICESALPDGSANDLYDKLQKDPVLSQTPIVVHVLKKSREQLEALRQRRFRGFLVGKIEPKVLLDKVTGTLEKIHVSPHYLESEKAGIASKTTLSLNATVMGKKGQQVVSRSKIEWDTSACLLCVPSSKKFGPAVVKNATNFREKDDIYNLFPISRVVGKGRQWITDLPEINLSSSAQADKAKRKVLYFDTSEERFEQFSQILTAYDIELVHAPTLVRLSALLKQDMENVGCLYLHELLGSDASSIKWKKEYSELPEATRPTMLVGTNSQNLRSSGTIHYIRRPFGLGVFVEALEAAFERANQIAAGVAEKGVSGIEIKYQAPALLLGLDESGGILQTRFPVHVGSRMDLHHDFLKKAWGGDISVEIVASSAVENRADLWQMRFSSVSAGTSKEKYWKKVCAALKAS